MGRSFDAVVESTATVDQVYEAFGDERYWHARFAAFDMQCALDVLRTDADGTVHVGVTQDLRHGVLPGPVAAFYPGDLSIRSSETWQPMGDGHVRGELRVDVVGAPGGGHGSGLLSPTDDGSQLRFSGTVQFKVPLVGGTVERYLAKHFADHIPDIQRFTTTWIGCS